MDSRRSTKESLDRSISILRQENAHGKSPISRLRTEGGKKTPKRISLHQGYPSRENVEQHTSDSSLVNRYENYEKSMGRHDQSGFDGSLTMFETDRSSYQMPYPRLAESSQTWQQSDLTLREMMQDDGSTGLVLKTDRPWRKTVSKLHHGFFEIVQGHSSQSQIFDTIADFIQNCSDTLDIMRGMQSKVEETGISREEVSLENERNTWRLIYCLYKNRISSMNFESEMDTDGNEKVSEKDAIEALLRNDSTIREYQLIIDWLETNGIDQIETLPKIEHFTDKTFAWENTLHQLANEEAGVVFRSSRPFVTCLDPDAPIREGKPLHDLDKEDDARLEKRMFFEVRCGRLQRAQELAIHCGQPWRATCLLGWKPHHDPNYDNPLTDTKLPIEGNPNRSLWKLTAWHMSQDVRIGEYYRAIYASLCGNVGELVKVARSWQDELWACVKCLMDIEVESHVRGIVAKEYVSMPDDYWKSKSCLADAFAKVESSKNGVIQAEATKPDHLIQKYLILDDIPELMKRIDTWIESGNCDSQFLRFLAHLVLFLRLIGKPDPENVGDKVLLAYVRVLQVETGDPTLVAFYTASLPLHQQMTNFAAFLESVKEYGARKVCLTAAEDANLNVEEITKLVVENARRKDADHSVDDDSMGKITESDMLKIDALDWLTFYQSQREEALWQGNALIRYFLTCEKVDAARKAFNKIPADAIEMIVTEHPSLEATLAILTTTNDLSKKISGSIREYLCYKAYLDAQEGFHEWFSHFHQGKPPPLEPLPAYATFTEKVAYDHKKAQYNGELERWNCTMQHHTKAVKQLLFNVLLFPDGGWLVDTINGKSDQDEEMKLRAHQMDKLRHLCIPKISLLLLNVMSEMEEHADCIELADTLASERYKLYKVFSKDKMRQMFVKICESSLALMDQKKDPWGFPK